MTYAESIKTGFRIIHRNWQLVLVQLAVIVISCMGFFILIGIPLAVAFIIFGLDLTELTKFNRLLDMFRGPSDIISRYLGLFIVIITSFVLYIFAVTIAGIFVFGGSIGVIGRAVMEADTKFRLQTFFSAGKKLFFPLLRFTALIAAIFLVIAFILGILGGSVTAIVSTAKEYEAPLAIFLGVFFSMIILAIGLVCTFGTIAITIYGSATLFFKEFNAFKSVKEATIYLYNHLNAFWLYTILFIGYFIVSFMFILLSYPFRFLPVIGTLLSLPYQLLSYIVQSYLGLVMLACLFSYYFSTACMPTAVDSTHPSDTSVSGTPEQEPLPFQKDGQG